MIGCRKGRPIKGTLRVVTFFTVPDRNVESDIEAGMEETETWQRTSPLPAFARRGGCTLQIPY